MHALIPWLRYVRLLHICSLGKLSTNSVRQPYHSDGDHESGKKHLAPHCLNVFIPLVDLEMRCKVCAPAVQFHAYSAHASLGPTEFVPTSHRLGFYDVDVDSLCLTPNAGGVILFDYRCPPSKQRYLSLTAVEGCVIEVAVTMGIGRDL